MPRKSPQRKSQLKRPPAARAGKLVPLAPSYPNPWQIAVVCLLLAVVTLVAYRAVRANDFLTYDDNYYVQQNPDIQHGVTPQSIEWAFTTFAQGNWHPLTWISHMVDWSLYGDNPAGHHIANACLHAANAILLFLFLLYMTGYSGRSAIVAFLFALHPAHVESVAWLSERKDLLCAFFWFLTLLAYAWHRRKPSWKRCACVLCGFACALMSKPMAVTLPFTLLLLDYWPLRRIAFAAESRSQWFSSLGKLCIEKLPLFIMSALSSIITFIAQRAGGAVAELEGLSVWARLCNAAIGYCRYILLMLWPDPLRAYYYYDVKHIHVFAALASFLALVFITALGWRFRKQRPYCLTGWLWFLGTLVPVIGIVQVGAQALAERYTYIPYIGLFIAVVWLAGDAVVKFPKFKLAAQLLAVAVIAACALKTSAQVKVWKDTVTLFSHVIEIDPRGTFPNLSLGIAYERQGNLTLANQYLNRALADDPNRPLTLSYSADCLMQTHDPRNVQLAGQRLQQALRIAPDAPYALANMALWSAMMGKPTDEETYSRKLLAVRPDFVRARLYLGDALQAQNKLDQAAQQYRQAVAIDPNNYQAHNSLGMILARQGLTDEALKQFRLSLAIQPDQAAAHFQAGRILAQTHRLPEAIDEYAQALRFTPPNAHAHDDLGVAFIQLGEFDKAAQQFSQALRIDPSDANARRNLGLAQAPMKTD